jgi:hypothetical protein
LEVNRAEDPLRRIDGELPILSELSFTSPPPSELDRNRDMEPLRRIDGELPILSPPSSSVDFIMLDDERQRPEGERQQRKHKTFRVSNT